MIDPMELSASELAAAIRAGEILAQRKPWRLPWPTSRPARP